MDSDLYARLAATGKPECPQCGYSLEGLPGPHRCPECGRPYGRDILTWRPTYPRWWWIGFVFATPALVSLAYNGWNSGMRMFTIVMIALTFVVWAIWLWRYLRARARDHVSIDDRGISYCSGGNVRLEFDWMAVRAVRPRRLWTMLHIELHDSGEYRLPQVLVPKDVVAFVEAANQFAEAARESDSDPASDENA